jgi:hypothetical protein
VAGTDSAGGPGPATLAFRTVNTLRAVRAANSDDSASSSDHHRDLRSFQPIASPDKKNQMDRASRHGLRQVHRDQPQAPRHTARSKDEDNETVEPRPGGHVQVSGKYYSVPRANNTTPYLRQTPLLTYLQ